ncbi:OCH1 like protein [Aspergillus parasiticus SU-1]|uniref:OCH1 like protein n=1 Tax=Aspergillus parasiticus (strain ATCC 56775 / NRRL 5862 / SRRC 143 / SU-1) TaxID=1403190 RepID=A0A0F0HYS0_ASPPU|nr:OCH1 like protein [Aspergillus parasiticus SU-1]
MVSRGRYRRLTLLSAILIFSLGLIAFSSRHRHVPAISSLKERYPLLWKHVDTFKGHGGVRYMPPSWVQRNPQPRTIIEAAQLAIQVTDIGEILGQMTCGKVSKWLQFVVEDEMAYFLWEDESMVEFIDHFEPQAHDHYVSLPSMVEKTDYFCITVATCVGGIYGDLDTAPLKSPASGSLHRMALFGIEADCLPTDHTCWRMGYPYPVQLTQWSFAWARDHPLLQQYIKNLAHQLQKISNHHGGLQTSAARTELQALDPLTLTGPEAVTRAAQEWLNVSAGLRWNALTGLHDGGKAKLVDDVLILPITSFR